MGITAFMADRDWTGALALIWVTGFFGLLGWSVYVYDIDMFREIVISLATPTVLILKYYYDKHDSVPQ